MVLRDTSPLHKVPIEVEGRLQGLEVPESAQKQRLCHARISCNIYFSSYIVDIYSIFDLTLRFSFHTGSLGNQCTKRHHPSGSVRIQGKDFGNEKEHPCCDATAIETFAFRATGECASVKPTDSPAVVCITMSTARGVNSDTRH